MKMDLWYKGEKIVFVDCFFYPSECVYRGNLYNKNGKIIGDYSSRDSIEIQKRFPYLFKN